MLDGTGPLFMAVTPEKREDRQIIDKLKRLCAFKILAQQVMKSMSRTMPGQNLPRPIVEHGLHAFDLAPRQVIEAGAGGKELAQQPVGVLVRRSRLADCRSDQRRS